MPSSLLRRALPLATIRKPHRVPPPPTIHAFNAA